MISLLKFFEVIVECFTFTIFMNKNISIEYRIEAFMLIFVSSLNSIVMFVFGVKIYLTYAVFTMLKVLYVIFNDLYVFCYLISRRERKPLLPPICMITTSLFIIEIKLVYDIFYEYLQTINNSTWNFLLEFLIEIQMLKFENSHFLKERLESYLLKAEIIDSGFKHLFVSCNNYSFEEKLLCYERAIIDILDLEAFPKFRNSHSFEKLENKFNQIRKSYYTSQV